MGEDKGTRKVTRREFEAKIKIRVHASSAGEVNLLADNMEGKTRDISDNGLGILCPFYIPEGANLEIELEKKLLSPGTEGVIRIVAQVTSSIMVEGEYRMGLQIKEISEEDRALIKGYVQK